MSYPWPPHLQATCSHDGSRQIGLRVEFFDGSDSRVCDVNRCFTCGAWLSLGPSDETDERVAVEIESASLAQSWADNNHRPGYDRFDWCPDGKGESLCDLCQTRYLARAIATHDTEQQP